MGKAWIFLSEPLPGRIKLSNLSIIRLSLHHKKKLTYFRYDDCRLLHIPNFYLGMYLTWLCAGNPTDHHSVSPCTAENTPDYSSNSEHDSYRLFRSHNVCVRVNLEMKPTSSSKSGLDNRPQVHMYSSTIRWLESLKWLFSGTSRPIKRGKGNQNKI